MKHKRPTVRRIVDGLSTIGEHDLMDKLRAATSAFAERAARWVLFPLSRTSPSRPRAGGDGERGQGLAEYALILSGIAIVAIASLVFLGGTITEMFWDPISEDVGRILTDVLGLTPAPPPP